MPVDNIDNGFIHFEVVRYHINHRITKIDGSAIDYLKGARESLAEVAMKLNSSADEVRQLLELVYPGVDLESPESTRSGAIHFGRAANWLDLMMLKPGEFYSSEDAKRLYDLANKMQRFYKKSA